MSSSGLETTVWGPAMWFSMHCISFNYPMYPTMQHKKEYAFFLRALSRTLPCRGCQQHFQQLLDETMFLSQFQNRATFARYVYQLHCAVNERLGKPSPPFEEVARKYERIRVDSGDVEGYAIVKLFAGAPKSGADTIQFRR